MESITAESNRKWLYKNYNKIERYLRRYHKREDHETVFQLLFWDYPDEGRKLIENFNLTNDEKKNLFYNWIIKQPAIKMLGLGDERMGKDVSMCVFFQEMIELCKLENKVPRIVTLGNIKKAPFTDEKDMYFSFLNIPSGTKNNQVWIYCSEIETVLPARETLSPENRMFSQLAGTFAQNHQKLFGLAKLSSKVDINFLRDCNVKFFKFISKDKLYVENVERDNILTGLGRWLLPKNPDKKDEVLLSFNNYLLTINVELPDWYTDEYSEMFRNVPMDKVTEFIDTMHSNGLTIPNIQIAVAQKFRKRLSKQEIKEIISKL